MNNRIEKIKKHITDNKVTYIVGVGCTVVTGVVVYVIMAKTRSPQIVNNVAPIIAPVFNNTATVNFGGYSHKVVKCVETGQIWETVKDAADTLGTTPSTLSKVLNGHTEDFAGKHYLIIALGCAA